MKTRKYLYPAFIFILQLLIAGCSGEPREDAAETENPVYEVRGRIIYIDMENEAVTVVHENIPDVMQAMRMTLRIDGPGEVAHLERGDIVRFQMQRRGASWFAGNFRVLPEETELDLPDLLQQIDPG